MEGGYEKERTGYHILTPVQCDLCLFRNIKGRYPTDGSKKYERLIIAIRRAPLDAFWSIEPETIRGDLIVIRKMGTMSRAEVGLEYWFQPLGTYELKDEVVMGVMCVTLDI